jgi:hypothetical protein
MKDRTPGRIPQGELPSLDHDLAYLLHMAKPRYWGDALCTAEAF